MHIKRYNISTDIVKYSIAVSFLSLYFSWDWELYKDRGVRLSHNSRGLRARLGVCSALASTMEFASHCGIWCDDGRPDEGEMVWKIEKAREKLGD